LLYRVTEENGTAIQWTGELSSTATMLAAGMSRDSLKPGDEIMITVHPAVAGTPQGLVSKLVRLADDRILVNEGFRSETRERP
jgi:hypothetical protein